MRFWIGPWTWGQSADGFTVWQPPAGVVAAVDFRSPAQCAIPATQNGVALFGTGNAVNLGAGYQNLGTDPDAVLTGIQKAAWRQLVGLPSALAGQSVRDALWETLTIQSDPTGQDRCLPLLPARATLECWFAGGVAKAIGFDMNAIEAAPVRDLLQRDYRRIRLACLGGLVPPQLYLRVLGYWVRKWGIPYRWFQPAYLPDEPDLPPATTISETFDTADSTTLGPLLSWSEAKYSGSGAGSASDQFSIVSNRIRNTPTGGSGAAGDACRANSNLSSADHYAQADVTNIASAGNNSQFGVCVRMDGGSPAGNFYFARVLNITQQVDVLKSVSGTMTSIGSGVGVTTSGLPKPIKLQANGSTLTALWNGSQTHSFTDTAVSSGTRCGIFAYNQSGTYVSEGDNFSASDLAAATVHLLALMGVGC